MRIGLDIDGVMYQWEKTARYMLREVLPDSPYKIKKGEWAWEFERPLYQPSKSWNYIEENVSPKHWKWLWNRGIKLGLFRYGHMYPGTIEAIRELAQIGKVVIITHRPEPAVADTLAWLSYIKMPLYAVHIMSHNEPKSTVRPMCDVYLDDKPENIEDYLHNTTGSACLMRRPWNADYTGGVVVSSWDEFIKHVRSHESRT